MLSRVILVVTNESMVAATISFSLPLTGS